MRGHHNFGARRKRFSSLLCGTAVAALALGGAARAQDTSSIETVVVTGTQIRGTAPVGSAVISIGQDQIEKTGAMTTMDILKQQPQVMNYGITDTQRTGTGGAANITYGSSINLRGLSPFATLTLIDGHRAPPSGTTGAPIDPSVVPAIMLSNVAIVADGASATYGSDAIAGVVNLIMRRNFNGVEMRARGGWGDSYNEHQFDILAGHKWDSGQFTIAFERAYHSALNGLDRSFYRGDQRSLGGSDYRVSDCNPGTIVANGTTYAIPAGGVTPATANTLVAGTSNLCNPLKYQDLVPEQGRYDIAATFDQKLTSYLSIYGDAYYSRRNFRRHVPLASGPLTVTNANPFFVAPPGSGVTSEVVNYFFGGQGIGNTWTDHGYSINEQATLGARVNLGGDWQWNTRVTYGYDHDIDMEVRVNASSGSVAAALASTNPATALNLFAPNSTALLQSLNNDVFGAPGISRLTVVDSKVDGPLFSLPGGDVRVAVGAQYQRNSLINGLINGTVGATHAHLLHQSREDHAFFGEIFVPLVGDGNKLPGVQALDLDVGVRYTDYTVVGSTTNPKVGVNWTITNGFKLHGSYGTSFRAPRLSELRGPVNAVFVQTYATPTGAVPGYTLTTSEPLQPEKATTWSLGADWTPTFLDGVHASLNYFHINYSNQIASYLSNLNLLENPSEYASLITLCPSAACSALIDKYINGTGPNPTPLPVFGPILPNPAAFVDGSNQNLATTLMSGIDFDLEYAFSTQSAGDFDFRVAGTYFTQYDTSPVPSAAISDKLNHIGYPLKLRFRANATWNYGPWTSVVYLNYTNGYTNNLATPVQSVDSYTTVDLHLDYRLGEGFNMPELRDTRLSLDVTNLFDTDPPYVNIIPSPNGGGGFDPANASPIGRVVSIAIDKKF